MGTFGMGYLLAEVISQLETCYHVKHSGVSCACTHWKIEFSSIVQPQKEMKKVHTLTLFKAHSDLNQS